MSYAAAVYNVMIASPGDVASERSIIRDVIYEWNAVNSTSKNIVLLPVGWESHSSPEMGTSAQDIINQQVLEKCDLLIGVFWTRIGTPTNDYTSGTVEEIEKHIATGKPAMLYFSKQPVHLDSVDSQQFAELQKFKETCKERSLFVEYDSHSDFKDKFYRHLQLKVINHDLFQFEQFEETEFKDLSSSTFKTKTPLPSLTLEAKTLLKEASQDPHGNILCLNYIGGNSIQANGKNFIESNDRREIAKWEAAIEELLFNSLIVERGYKGEIYEVTNTGYQIADMIEL